MFDNIGGKLKGLAKVLCWTGIAASVIAAFALWSTSSYYNNTIGTGLAVLVVGVCASYVASWSIYAFGQITDDLHSMRMATDESTMRPRYRAAVNAMKQKKYDEAIGIFEEIRTFGDSSTMIHECYYSKAADLKKAGKYAEAIESYEAAGSYKKTEEQISDCWYQLGVIHLAAKKYDDACMAFEEAGEYKNAREMLLEVNYIEGKDLIRRGDKKSACELFFLIDDYKDVQEIIAADNELSQMYEAYLQENEQADENDD